MGAWPGAPPVIAAWLHMAHGTWHGCYHGTSLHAMSRCYPPACLPACPPPALALPSPPQVYEVQEGAAEVQALMDSQLDSQALLVVLDWHAPWAEACAAAVEPLAALAALHPQVAVLRLDVEASMANQVFALEKVRGLAAGLLRVWCTHEGCTHEGCTHEGCTHEGCTHEGCTHVWCTHEGCTHEGCTHEGCTHEGCTHEGCTHEGGVGHVVYI